MFESKEYLKNEFPDIYDKINEIPGDWIDIICNVMDAYAMKTASELIGSVINKYE